MDRHLQNKAPEVVALYERFIALARECGPFTYAVSKTAITLKGTRRQHLVVEEITVPVAKSIGAFLGTLVLTREVTLGELRRLPATLASLRRTR